MRLRCITKRSNQVAEKSDRRYFSEIDVNGPDVFRHGYHIYEELRLRLSCFLRMLTVRLF